MLLPQEAVLAVRYSYEQLIVRTGSGEGELVPTQEVSLHDITPQVRELVRKAGIVHGTVNLISQHTTTALTINEYESRLLDDVRDFVLEQAPPNKPYKHNDLHLRPASEADFDRIDQNWMSQGKGTLAEFIAQEPINAHAHLGAMMLGASETVPVADGRLCIGAWQSIILVDLDGPRERKVGVQVTGIGPGPMPGAEPALTSL
jgi:thiamine phosphate synthase YjbQ (UPF0047 family)